MLCLWHLISVGEGAGGCFSGSGSEAQQQEGTRAFVGSAFLCVVKNEKHNHTRTEQTDFLDDVCTAFTIRFR